MAKRQTFLFPIWFLWIFFKHKYGEVYEITGNFISKERVDGFDSYSKKYNEKVVHIVDLVK